MFSRGLLCATKPKFARTVRQHPHPARILDVGIANCSYEECRVVFPGARYHGLDHIDPGCAFIGEDRFIACNLEEPEALQAVDGPYDLILANHVLEHLRRGEEVYAGLCDRLAPGGQFYAEFPSLRTAYRRASAWGYHFHHDPTHRRVYGLETLANLAMDRGCRVLSCGPVSTPLKNLLALPRAAIAGLRGEAPGAFLPHFRGLIDHMHVVRPG